MSRTHTGDGRRRASMGHAKHTWECPECGKVCRGNGGKTSHKAKHVREAGLDPADHSSMHRAFVAATCRPASLWELAGGNVQAALLRCLDDPRGQWRDGGMLGERAADYGLIVRGEHPYWFLSEKGRKAAEHGRAQS